MNFDKNDQLLAQLLAQRSTPPIPRRLALGSVASLPLLLACEALGIKANVNTTTTVNGQTTARQYEIKNWGEFEAMMGQVATDFSSFAREVGATTAELARKLTDVPPQGHVTLSALDATLKPFEGDIRYDYLEVASRKSDAEYDFKYVQIGMPQFDALFRSAAEMYSAAYQLLETGRHIHLAAGAAGQVEVDSEVDAGTKHLPKATVDQQLGSLKASTEPAVVKTGDQLGSVWACMAVLGATLASKASATAQTGAMLVASAPMLITNPKLVLHLDLIVKGLGQSVDLVKDTGGLLGGVVG